MPLPNQHNSLSDKNSKGFADFIDFGFNVFSALRRIEELE